MTTALLVNDTAGVCHWGCTGTTRGLKRAIGALGYTVESVIAEDIPRLGGALNTAADFDTDAPLARLRTRAPCLPERLAAADVVVVNAEGCLHGDRSVAKTLLYLAWYAAERLGRPVDLVNHSCYPQDTTEVADDALLAIYRRAYEAVRFVAVREPLSHALVARWLRRDARESFDCLPLYIEAQPPAPTSAPRGLVFATSVIWQRAWASVQVDVMARLAEQGHALTVLVGSAGARNHEDAAFLRDLQRAWRRRALRSGRFWRRPPWRVVDAASLDEWLGLIADSRLLVSGRFHHSIAAACVGTPWIALDSNTPKIDGLRAAAGVADGPRYGEPGWGERLTREIEARLAAERPDPAEVRARRARWCELAYRNVDALRHAAGG
ncbi:polysaccharide pyruvyl transferase family protein [Salinisphaera orenii]|uniref:Polysaccharide pyruvyl transferase domain-containing protein n=1 Tax=Salinisphaera orenii YIM 95161 TaxID=1051139 RepID=A0A423PVT1_9GAMM|nr:polysaccharide pyruvyl transferase family protein [Salinisphaera halophila]ROO29632.1 hypothetical protein SAHL_08925 [Salinisphaera halophila YIM 95161]